MNTKEPNDSLPRSTGLPPEKELKNPEAGVRGLVEEGSGG